MSRPAHAPPAAGREGAATRPLPAWLPALAVLVAALGVASFEAAAEEQLVPMKAGRYERTDQMGFHWDLNPNGSIRDGSSDCFDGALELMVDGSRYSELPPAYTTANGESFVCRGTLGAIGIERRCRLDPTRGAIRYVELFENRGKTEASIKVVLQTDLGASARSWTTSQGRNISGGGVLAKDEYALVATHGRGPRPAVLFVLTAPRARVAPTISIARQRKLVCTWTLRILPGETAALLHSIAQRRWQVAPPPDALRAELKPFLERGWARGLPPLTRIALLNHPGSFAGGSLAAAAPANEEILALAEAYDEDRGDQDVVILGEAKRLVGSVTGGPLQVDTRRGKSVIALADVAIIRGGANQGRSMRLYLRNGEILAGSVRAESLRFLAPSGLEFQLDPAAVDAVFLRERSTDGQVDAGVQAFVTLLDGTKLGLAIETATPLRTVTPWGELDVPLAALDRIHQSREPVACLWMQLAGDPASRLPVALTDAAFTLETDRFGPLEVEAAAITAWVRVRPAADTSRKKRGERSTETPYALLVAECRLAGAIVLERIHLVSDIGATPILLHQIASIDREDGDEPLGRARFEVKLHGEDGGTLRGVMREHLLPLDTPYGRCHIPTRHLVGYRAPAPPPRAEDPEARDDAPGDEPSKEGEKR